MTGIDTARGDEACMGCHTPFTAGDTYWLIPDGPTVNLIACADCAWQNTTGHLDFASEPQ